MQHSNAQPPQGSNAWPASPPYANARRPFGGWRRVFRPSRLRQSVAIPSSGFPTFVPPIPRFTSAHRSRNSNLNYLTFFPIPFRLPIPMSLLRAALRTPLRSFSRASAASTGTQLASLAYRRYLSDEARSIIDKAVKAQPVVLFMKGTPDKPQCGFSRAVIQILDLQGVPPAKLQTYNILADPELRSGIKEYSNWPTIPQLYVNGEFIGGCDIVMSMHQNGELESLFTKEKVVEPAEAELSPAKRGSS